MEPSLLAYFNIDIAIVIVFLAINLAVGFYYGRNVKTIEDYALGGRNFSTGALVSTIVATVVTGGTFMYTLTRTYDSGLYDLIPRCGLALSLIFTTYFFVPRMASFLGSLSVAESMGKYYGKNAQIITAICSIVANVGSIAVQYKVFGGIVSYLLGVDAFITITVAGIIVTFYSAFGGIRAVTFTDVLQSIVFTVVIPLIGIIIWQSTINIPNFTFSPVFQSPNFDLKQIVDLSKIEFWQMIVLLIYFAMPSLFPSEFQRISMGRNIAQVKKACAIASIIWLALILFIAWIGFLIYSIAPNLTSDQLVPFIVDNYTYAGFRGLVVIGVVAMAMSSADSFINVASVLFAHDLCKPLNILVKDELKLTRTFAVVIGLGSIVIALSGQNIFDIVLFANAFYLPIVTIPLLLTIWGLRTTPKSTLSAMSAGFFTVIIWKLIGIDFDPIVPAMFINLIVMLGTHYLLKQEGGWVDPRKEFIEENIVENNVGIFTYKQTKYSSFLKKYSANDTTYSFFGIFSFITTLSTIYLTQDKLFDKYSEILTVIHALMLITSSVFMLYMMWSPRLKHPILVCFAWNFALTYILSFCSSFFLLLSNFDNIQLAVFTLNIMILLNLARWKTVLYMIALGFSCSYILFKYIDVYSYTIELNYNSIFYMLLFFISAVLMIVKPRQEEIEATEAKVDGLEGEVGNLAGEVGNLNLKITDLEEVVTHYDTRVQDQMMEIERLGATAQKILNNVNHELRLPVGNVMNFAEMLSEGLEKYSKEQLKMLSDEVFKNSTRLSSMILNMLDLATLDVKKIDLNKKNINLSELVEDRVNHCRKIYLEQKPIKFEINSIANMPVFVDPNYMRQVVDNIIINAINYSQEGTIKISIQPLLDKNMAEIVIQDEGMGIPKSELFDIFTPFKMGTKSESKAQGRGVGLALCKSAVQAHGGTIEAQSDGIRGAIFIIRLKL